MKRNNVAKRFGIASLCLATAISAFSGISSLANNVVFAEGDTIQTTDIVEFVTKSEETKAEVVTRNVYTGSCTKATQTKCLNVTSEGAYEAKFKTIFTDEATLRFNFPETDASASDPYGNFVIRVADATDASNYFEIEYYVIYGGSVDSTGVAVKWKGLYRTSTAQVGSNAYNKGGTWQKSKQTSSASAGYAYAPSFLGKGQSSNKYLKREGGLTLQWSSGTLQVYANHYKYGDASDMITTCIGAFDGSYTTASGNGFKSKSTWGLPKMSFPNGYTISFSSTNATGTGKATDVSFSKVLNGTIGSTMNTLTSGETIDFANATLPKDNYMKAYDTIKENADKALLGWKDTDGALHSTKTALTSADIGAYTPVFLGFEKIQGASLRIDTVYGNSGLRFINGFNPDDYKALSDARYIKTPENETGCITFGTLLAYKESLTEGIFDVVNYATQLEAGTNVLQAESTKKIFDYTAPVKDNEGKILTDDNGNVITKDYKAYSVALVNPNIEYAQSFAARGYIVVAYTDGTTATFYTQYTAENDIRSIKQIAEIIATSEEAKVEFDTYTTEQKNVVLGYAGLPLIEE